ncbi:MAG TPA: methyltransferase domain-containing protein [Solirubrobacteraceae bacterium]|nr:methyltransferase domain-containing protein [Solirubrobacteraceae bacterium]
MIEPGRAPDADWRFLQVPRGRRDVVLDLSPEAGGGLALAPEVHQVILLVSDPARLDEARAHTTAAGSGNILAMTGDPHALPFLEASFTSVLCAGQIHRREDPTALLGEIRRVLQPRGWLGVAEPILSEHAAEAAVQERDLRDRDPGHVRGRSASALQDLLARSGFEVVGAETREARGVLGCTALLALKIERDHG